MARLSSCQAVAADFSKPVGNRSLLPDVQLTTLPDDGAGTASIRNNLVYLHERIVGESLQVNDPEIDASYALFKTVYQNHLSTNDTSLDATCRSGAISTDATFTIHAWMAVIDSLLNDFDFLYR